MIPNRAQLIAELRRQHAAQNSSPEWRAILAELKDNPPRNPLDEAISEWWATLTNSQSSESERLVDLRQLLGHIRET